MARRLPKSAPWKHGNEFVLSASRPVAAVVPVSFIILWIKENLRHEWS